MKKDVDPERVDRPPLPMERRIEALNFRHLHHFYEVARRGSLKAAAEVLGLSSATLSAQIRQLEEWAGGPLLVREHRRGVRPTDLGRRVWRHAERIFAEGEALIQTLDDRAGTSTEPLRLGLPSALPSALRHSALDALHTLEPKRTIDIVSAPSHVLFDALRDGRIDAALTDRTADPAIETVWTGPAIQNAGVAFVAKPMVAREASRDFPRSLTACPLVLPTHAVALRDRLDRWFREHALIPNVVGEADDPRDQAALANAHEALFVVPAIGVDAVLARGEVELVGRTQAVRASFHLAGSEKGLSPDEVARWSDHLRRRAADLMVAENPPPGAAPGSSTGKELSHEEDSRSDAA